MIFEEKTVSSEEIYKGKIVTLKVDQVAMPGGKLAARELVAHPGGVGVVALTGENEVILVKQYRKPIEKAIYEIPAGKLDPGEEHRSCGLRELEEEIGFTVFTRSSRGVIPTEKGREFLVLAKKAVKQYQALENYCSRDEKDNISLHICVPRASYITGAFTAFLKKHAKGR